MGIWVGHTKSRSIEMGSVIVVSSDDSNESAPVPSGNDHLCIHVSGEKFPAIVISTGDELLALNLLKGPTLFLEPVPVGHPAHGEHAAPGTSSSVWKVISVR